MKDLNVTADASVDASPDECVEFLAEVDRYPSWYPQVVRTADVLERGADGVPVRARADVHLSLGPVSHDLKLVLAVAVSAGREVRLTRVADDASDEERFALIWQVEPESPTRLRLELAVRVDLPRFVPVGSIGGPFAQGFVDAASRALDGAQS
jgi:hypothetical protein